MTRLVRSTPLLALSIAGSLTPLAYAGQIRVPADYPTLAAALAAAAPNDMILVQTQVQQSNVVITKPVAIVGDPLLTIRNSESNCGTNVIQLAGTSGGNVTIANAHVSSSLCGSPGACVSGTGFDSLYLFEVEVWGMTGILDGTANGVEGVRTTGIPFVALERCFVRSTQGSNDACYSSPSTLGGKHNRAAVDVGHATLLALDSTLRGGNGGLMCTNTPACAPPEWIPLIGGEGASAVKAGKFYSANSIVEAGIGMTYMNYPGGSGPGQPCWSYGSYPAVIATTDTPLPGTIQAVGNPLPASTWFLDFVLPSGASYALASFGPGAPISLPGLGTAFLDPATFFPLGLLSATGGAGTAQYFVPNDSTLLGVRLCLQPLHATQGLLRPVTAVIAP